MSNLNFTEKYSHIKVVFVLFTAIFFSSANVPAALISSSAEDETCESCKVESDPKTLTGIVESISQKAKLLQVRNGKETTIFKYNNDTILLGLNSINELSILSKWTITYREDEGIQLAISIESPQTNPSTNHKQIDATTLFSWVSVSQPETPDFTLIDARPIASFRDGHIKGAISIYDGDFHNNLDMLPKNKAQLIIYYCDGTS